MRTSRKKNRGKPRVIAKLDPFRSSVRSRRISYNYNANIVRFVCQQLRPACFPQLGAPTGRT